MRCNDILNDSWFYNRKYLVLLIIVMNKKKHEQTLEMALFQAMRAYCMLVPIPTIIAPVVHFLSLESIPLYKANIVSLPCASRVSPR